MAESPQGELPGAQAPAAQEFVPARTELKTDVLDASFVTRTFPDMSFNSSVVGLCAVPYERAGMADLGWHITDFLAFKTLLVAETSVKSQTWLSQCDISNVVKASPEKYVHGQDGRVVKGAATTVFYADERGRLQPRADHIKVEPSAEKLMVDFFSTILKEAQHAREKGHPLVIIVCGLTSVEQDVYFGKTESKYRFTSTQIRHTIGNDVDVIMITPSQFSEGWQVNPAFCRSPVDNVRASRTEFLAKQFGGVFAKDIVERFLGWSCPFLDQDRVDEKVKEDRFLGPIKPSEEQKQAADALKVKLHSALAGRLSLGHGDHGFNFDSERDDWTKLIGPRAHRPLEHYQRKWEKLGMSPVTTTSEKVSLFGNAFGGNRESQVNHIKHLVQESFQAWPRYWALPFGRKAKEVFDLFLLNKRPDDRDCREIFNIMEHRASTAVLADTVVKYLALPVPYNERCKDWNESRWTDESSDENQRAINRPYAEISKHIPLINVPPDVNPNQLSKIQSRLEVPATYIAVSLRLRYLTHAEGLEAAEKHIVDLFREIKIQQIKLLVEDPGVCATCAVWLKLIGMPIRSLDAATASVDLDEIPVRATADLPIRRGMEPTASTSGVGISASTHRRGDAVSVLIQEAALRLDPDKEIKLARQERQELVNALLRSTPGQNSHIADKLKGVLAYLDFMEGVAKKKTEEEGNAQNGVGIPGQQTNVPEPCIGQQSQAVSERADQQPAIPTELTQSGQSAREPTGQKAFVPRGQPGNDELGGGW
ncbi:hypothetical protein GGS23DRAFT_550093 [Durotheca rogersii]|uniref:uncharacterized protein n=1 Tax=Durotheca rogersii TaxID=419775 RepID=UPI00221F7602|nr:uncharacterized protein GGS23DRAFT_550093 [Durotheca rogersii]KAI5867810.1 hypothetical protein GGS23DRAFT_550093 [Durotheca rogersii]